MCGSGTVALPTFEVGQRVRITMDEGGLYEEFDVVGQQGAVVREGRDTLLDLPALYRVKVDGRENTCSSDGSFAFYADELEAL
jgi:hypothetical protein